MQEIKKLLQIMKRLRGEEGCPWDLEQTHLSLRPYLLEETYEVLEALENEEMNNFCEELGDLLLQIIFHAQIAEENGYFTFADVVRSINEKMIRRHPHVFSEENVHNSQEVLIKWEQIKAWERRDQPARESLLDGLPPQLPALMLAQKIQKKASKAGFDWEKTEDAWQKVQEEVAEVEQALIEKRKEGIAEELGDVLFSVVNVARMEGLQAELLLRETIGKFKKRFSFIEEQVALAGRDFTELNLEEMDFFWEKAKEQQKNDKNFENVRKKEGEPGQR